MSVVAQTYQPHPNPLLLKERENNLNHMEQLTQNSLVLLVIVLWTLPWKGYALWIAARKGSKPWFIAILILNTLAILEILYIYIFSKKGEDKIEQK